MKLFAVLAGCVLLCHSPLQADPLTCDRPHCAQTYSLASVSERKTYGLLVAAPETGCRRVRFSVTLPGGVRLGQTLALGPGELGLIRMGKGFAPGVTTLVISAYGCRTPPAMVRRVTLAKASPDHGARASGYGF